METSDLFAELESLYAQVPATRCAGSGDCCVLTQEEFDNDYATMFPLYRAEYENIAAYVERHFSPQRRQELFAFVEERPRRCPFLGADHRCTIYPARPLICRTYGAMNPPAIVRESQRQQGVMPQEWIRRFARRELAMVCPRVAVLEPEKVARHARNLMEGRYESELERLSALVEIARGERQQLFAQVTGRSCWPVRWTWGGFNALRFAPLEWLRAHFGAYWKRAELPDAG
jgi:Fe-S-cluster containining protein